MATFCCNPRTGAPSVRCSWRTSDQTLSPYATPSSTYNQLAMGSPSAMPVPTQRRRRARNDRARQAKLDCILPGCWGVQPASCSRRGRNVLGRRHMRTGRAAGYAHGVRLNSACILRPTGCWIRAFCNRRPCIFARLRGGSPSDAGIVPWVLLGPILAGVNIRRSHMLDVLFVVLTVSFFALAWAYAHACERI